jgi:hypothetical protein
MRWIITAVVVCLLVSATAAQAAIQNPSLETDANGDGLPDCWQSGGYGTNTYSFARTSNAHTGSFAEKVSISGYSSGDRKLVTSLDSGTCAQPVQAGHTYRFGAWYMSDVTTEVDVYLRTSGGSWGFWKSSARLPASSSWTHATWVTPPVPSGYTDVGFGLGIRQIGAITTDDYSFADANATSPPPLAPQCSDGIDNDADGLTDYPDDPGCTGAGDNDETDSPPPPASNPTSVHYGFDQPNGANNLWGTEPWVSRRVDAPNWTTLGTFYSVPDADSPTGTNVLTQPAADYDSSGTSQAWLHDPVTLPDGSWGTEHRVDLVVMPVKWGSTAQAKCSWAGGTKIFMGRQADVYETSTYTIELSTCAGHAYIQKKSWGINDCGKDPRAVDCGAGGTWYNLNTVNVQPAAFGQWHTYTGIKRDNPDGSVTLIGLRDGVELLRYTEVPNDIRLGPLRGGREGWRSNMTDWHMDSYDVRASP